MKTILSRLDIGAGYAASALRIATGVLLAWHGYRKFADGLDGFEGFLSFLELPAPGFLAVVVALLELVGGIMLALGLLTRPVAALFVVQFALIFVWVKLIKLDPVFLVGGEQPGVELDLIYLFTSLFFVAGGPGTIAADHILGLEGGQEERPVERQPSMA